MLYGQCEHTKGMIMHCTFQVCVVGANLDGIYRFCVSDILRSDTLPQLPSAHECQDTAQHLHAVPRSVHLSAELFQVRNNYHPVHNCL